MAGSAACEAAGVASVSLRSEAAMARLSEEAPASDAGADAADVSAVEAGEPVSTGRDESVSVIASER